jgi:NAD(P)H-dependent FMN reductase
VAAEYLVFATSLRPGSHSRLMAEQLAREYEKLGAAAEMQCLRESPLPMCDGETAYDDPKVTLFTEKIQAARVIVIATPIYNYDANAAAKNLVELTGSAWEDKIAGFLCAAGGPLSYMSVIGLANSLMLDFRTVVLPRFVYATSGDFAGGKIASAEIIRRIQQFAQASMRLQNN